MEWTEEFLTCINPVLKTVQSIWQKKTHTLDNNWSETLDLQASPLLWLGIVSLQNLQDWT